MRKLTKGPKLQNFVAVTGVDTQICYFHADVFARYRL